MRFIPTWRLAVAMAAGGVVVLAVPAAPVAAFWGINLLLLVVALVDAMRIPRVRALEVTRDVPAVIPLDSQGTVTWTVHNHGTSAAVVRLADDLAPSLRPENRRARVRVGPGQEVTASTTLQPSRRGRFQFAQITLRAEGPWRLVARQRAVQVASTLRVYPMFRSRKEAELRIERGRILEHGLRSVRARGSGTEFEQLREYTVDDEFRHIDWFATARSQHAVVRTYRAERNQTVMLLLDTGRLMAHRVRDPQARGEVWGDVPRLDHAMDAVMMMTTVATRLGDRAGMVAFSDQVHAAVAPGHTRLQLGRVTEAMYALEPQLVESDYRAAFTETLSRYRRRSMLVVLSELVPEAVEETLIPALPMVLRSHIVVVAAVRDPGVQLWANANAVEPSEAYRKAAAVDALEKRRRLTARLRGMGAVVIDEPPGQLAPRLADAYLQVKSTGRL